MNVGTKQKFMATAAASVFCAATCFADISLSVRSGGSGTVTLNACGAGIPYEVRGVLSDALNEGLAGFTFDLSFSGGPMDLADDPVAAPMSNFDRPLGIAGPSGFRGRIVDGKLVGVGGAQNTVRKDGNWNVVTGVGHTATVLLTGWVTVPTKPGTYTLSLSNARASVIKQGEDGTGPFWAVQPVGSITTSDLTIIVQPPAAPAAAADNGPLCANEQLSLSGGPNSAIDYRWTGPRGFFSSEQNPVLSDPIPGVYRLTVTDIRGCETTAVTTVEVLTRPCDPSADCNGNGVHDVCDVARTLADGCATGGVPAACVVRGDTNVDGTLNLSDFPFWKRCLMGPGQGAGGCCSWIDLDGDGDVDLVEIARFQRCMSSNAPNCLSLP